MAQQITAFADEFGNNSTDFKTQGSHFIIASIITKTDTIDNLRDQINEIRKNHRFQTGELKSSKVKSNHLRRIKILEDIVRMEISIYAVIIDKRELSGPGFNFKKSFYKYSNNLLYKELYSTYPSLDLYVDEHGRNAFMREFKKYVEKHHSMTLFSGSDFNFQNSKQSEFIQLADFVAGSLGYIFDESKKSKFSNDFYNILKPRISSLNFFPHKFKFEEIQETKIDEAYDSRIAKLCFLKIQGFLDRVTGTDQQKIDQINFLKLLWWLQSANPNNRYITTNEILNHLNQNRQEKIREEYFRTKVVGNLRDRGILIASSRYGYKIPTSAKDLDSFMKLGKGIILPMLNRIKEARESIKLATMNELDLLSGPEYKELKKLLGD